MSVSGAGLGLRRDLLAELQAQLPDEISFFEAAPENWLETGGRMGRAFRALTERRPLLCHGLSLSLGGPAPLDTALVRRVGKFLRTHRVRYYSEHLSWCADEGHLYDLAPIPFTEEAVKYVAARIRRVQDLLGREIAVENISYYAELGDVAPGTGLTELEFIAAVLERADCGLLLDINNIWVNSINHGYDAHAFLRGVPVGRVRYLHVAGHKAVGKNLRLDTHGAAVSDPVWTLLEAAYARFGAVPTVLERDFNIPPLAALAGELRQIRRLQERG